MPSPLPGDSFQEATLNAIAFRPSTMWLLGALAVTAQTMLGGPLRMKSEGIQEKVCCTNFIGRQNVEMHSYCSITSLISQHRPLDPSV